MHITSVNVGVPRPVTWNDRTYLTGIFKDAVSGRVPVRTLNLDGDRQADLTVHGGASKAVYLYPSEHYEYPDLDLPPGMFGENLTLAGLDETGVHIGDRLRAGTAELVVTEPRLPCVKLGLRFGRMDVIKRFADSRRSGFYCAVVREGEAGAGDAVEVLARDPRAVTVRDIVRVFLIDKDDRETMTRATQIDALPAMWRDTFRERLGLR
jgi:MOSC domain-containing protein YiiM